MDPVAIGSTLGMGAAIAGMVALIKSAFPALPARVIPLIVLAVSFGVVAIGIYSGELDMRPLEALMAIVAQAVSALGAREALVSALPQASALPSRGTGS